MTWRKKLEDFIFKRDVEGTFAIDLRYLQSIARTLAGRSFRNWLQGERGEYWSEAERKIGIDEEGAREAFMKFISAIGDAILDKGYSTLILPTMLPERNLRFAGEETPTEEMVWKMLYLTYSSIKFGDALVNLDNISDKGRMTIWRILITDRVVRERTDMTPIKRKLDVRLRASDEFFNTFSLLAFLREKAREEMEGGRERNIWFACRDIYGFNDMTSVIVMSRKETKGEYHVFSYLSPLFQMWLDRKMVAFFDSFTNIRAKREAINHISREREKLIFHLFKHKEICGELLARLTSLKSEYELKEGRYYGVRDAKFFFSELSVR